MPAPVVPPVVPDAARRRRSRIMLGSLLTVAALMVVLAFASAPLYAAFCRVTGWGGTPQVRDSVADRVLDRTMRVRFTASLGEGLPWTFAPDQPEITLKVGEPALVYFKVKNESTQPVAGQAVYNVAPDKIGSYFVKVNCFCFTEQILDPGQTAEMPVYFYLDPALDEDPSMRDVRAVTLSYTFYPHSSDALEARVAQWRAARGQDEPVPAASGS
jgi:cytochrome c oxidase assembly protein subunit 11